MRTSATTLLQEPATTKTTVMTHRLFSFKLTLITLVSCLMLSTLSQAVDKRQAVFKRIDNPVVTSIRIAPDGSQTVGAPEALATAIQCVSRHDSGAVWAIDSWILGNELYK